eukprot:scaffold47737_cov19-Tisochrysis_lutea.AAC.1
MCVSWKQGVPKTGGKFGLFTDAWHEVDYNKGQRAAPYGSLVKREQAVPTAAEAVTWNAGAAEAVQKAEDDEECHCMLPGPVEENTECK